MNKVVLLMAGIALSSSVIAEENLITPADMPEAAQTEMYNAITGFNKCMMKNRLEYHQQGIRVANVADKTLQACEPHLDTLSEVLTANNVNVGLNKSMVHSMRSRAARKLMAAVMQSVAGQAAAAANAKPTAE
ncbi:hypothetical protein A9Q92_05900 [Methylophaga sp. 42_8_T64]|nr:hypothetical protein A9Q92_05900 [Methylophaga sp. 42_8_T64]